MSRVSGLSNRALAFYGAARGAVALRASTAEFFQAITDAAQAFGYESHGLSFAEVNQLRSAAVRVRNAADRFNRADGSTVLDASMIGREPYGRSLDQQAAQPLYHVTITLHTADPMTGDISSEFRRVQFAGDLAISKDDLLAALDQDAQQLADTYGQTYAGHDVIEILAV